MNQEQDWGVKSTFPKIKEIERQWLAYKDLTVEKNDEFYQKVKETAVKIDLEKEMYLYCQEFHPDLVRSVRDMHQRVRDKGDNQIAVEGQTGGGKSTCVMCQIILLHYMQGKKFNLVDDVVYLPREKELSERLTKLEQKQNLWVDEAIKSLNKLKWQNKDQMESNEIIQTERFRYNTIWYCIPSFYDLNTSFRKNLIKVRMWVIPKYRCCRRIKDIHPDMGATDPWHLDENIRLLKGLQYSVRSSNHEILEFERKLTNYYDDFSWPNLAEIPAFYPYHLMYEILKKKSRLLAIQEASIMKVTTEHDSKHKDVLKAIIRHEILENKKTFKVWWDQFKGKIPCHVASARKWWREVTLEVKALAELEAKRGDSLTSNIVIRGLVGDATP